MSARNRMRLVRLLLVCGGCAVAGFGLSGLVELSPNALFGVAEWLAAVVLAHDLVLAPAAFATGALMAHRLPRGARGVVAGGLAVAAAVTLVALPPLLAPGSGNPTVLVLDYPRNLVVVLAAVALGTSLVLVARPVARRALPRRWRAASPRRPEPPGGRD